MCTFAGSYYTRCYKNSKQKVITIAGIDQVKCRIELPDYAS